MHLVHRSDEMRDLVRLVGRDQGKTPGMVTTLERVEQATGAAIGAVSGAVSHLRPKPLHPKGAVLEARLERTGAAEPWGVPWLDDPGVDEGIVRLSRSLGLPDALPDVLGIALRWESPQGLHDLLLATTPMRPVLRHLLLPRRDGGHAAYSTLLPYRAGRRLCTLGLLPRGDWEFDLVIAHPTQEWQPIGRLTCGPGLIGDEDAPVRFDAVLNPPPGLTVPAGHRLIREPAYQRARRSSVALPD